MAAQVFSGNGNFSYTNNTGQNVRIIINYLECNAFSFQISMNWAGTATVLPQGSPLKIGRNLAFNQSGGAGNNMHGAIGAVPTEIMISSGQTFSITAGTTQPQNAITAYNIVVIPEAG
jgi:hypothetical protein